MTCGVVRQCSAQHPGGGTVIELSLQVVGGEGGQQGVGKHACQRRLATSRAVAGLGEWPQRCLLDSCTQQNTRNSWRDPPAGGPVTPWQASLSASDHVDRIVADVQALSRDPEANAEAIRRVREALPEQ